LPGYPKTLDAWLARQASVHAKSIDLDLSRVAAVARKLGVHRPSCPVITVGGTNGKGSVVAHLDAMLRSAGLATGVFTSPHLVRYNERIKVGRTEASDAELIAAFEQIEHARGEVTLTYFEYSTLAALLIFAARAVEVMILEVGLGGRLDATNLVDANVAVVVSIGFDHRDWLGDTLEAIGHEKAGIFRADAAAVLGSPDMPRSVFAAIESARAQAIVAERDFVWTIGATTWSYRGLRWTLEDLPPSALLGEIQYRNAATAIAALEVLSQPSVSHLALPSRQADWVSNGLRTVELPGRFQIIPGAVEWILDVAHNEPAARVLAAQLRERPCSGRTFGVVSILKDKDIPAIRDALAPVFDHWILCSLRDPRGLAAQELASRLALPQQSVTLAKSVAAGCELARDLAKAGDRIVACGSFLVVGSALQWL
jgi:dihydrofolate synthase / folylpolyglutamate synthase